MGMTIWKYLLEPTNEQDIMMPEGAKVLSVGVQYGELCVWALVHSGNMLKPRTFYIRGTGHDASGLKAAEHLGTVEMRGGALIFHIFEKGRK